MTDHLQLCLWQKRSSTVSDLFYVTAGSVSASDFSKMFNFVWEICLLLPSSSRHCPTQEAQWPPYDEEFPFAVCSDGRRWLLEALLPPWIPEIPTPQVVLWEVTIASACLKEFTHFICNLCQPGLHSYQKDTEVNKGCAVVFSWGAFLSDCSKATGTVQLEKTGLGFLEMLVSLYCVFSKFI